jgi:HD superfamily phosphohydrolase
MTALDDLRGQVNEVVDGWLGGFTPKTVRQSKLLRDPVIGFETLRPYEVAIVDSPVFQRLRYIHQTALAYHVYPGAHHTRFEHALGVAHRVEQVASALNGRNPGLIGPKDIAELRLAGLLHDVGHGPFSHLSESIFSERFSAELAAIGLEEPMFLRRDLGEILSYLIVTSTAFKTFAHKVFDGFHLAPLDLDKVAGFFVGYAPPEELFMAEMISGPFDADKLDYFHRDCYYTGIRAEIDVERILSVIDIDGRSTEAERHLVIRRAGVHHMEHIIFSKMLLFSSVYHHHKIRALECGVRSMFRAIWNDPSRLSISALRFPNMASILTMTDSDFWTLAKMDPVTSATARALTERRELPMRALALNMATIDQEKSDRVGSYKFQLLNEFPAKQREIGDTIFNLLSTEDQVSQFGVWFDFPRTPKVSSDAHDTRVDRGDEYVRLETFFPTPQWVAAYTDNKLTAHVFYDPPEAKRRTVASKAREYFREVYGLVAKDIAEEGCFKEDGELSDFDLERTSFEDPPTNPPEAPPIRGS